MDKLTQAGALLKLPQRDIEAVVVFNKQVRMALASKKQNWVIAKTILGSTLKTLYRAFEELLALGVTIEEPVCVEQLEKEALIALRYWCNGGTSFTCNLYSLFKKADPGNLQKLTRAFPIEMATWLDWYNAEDEDVFWENRGFGDYNNNKEGDKAK